LGRDLAYLAWLTRVGLKPLSRWEAAFDSGLVGALGGLDLQTAVVHRKTLAGGPVRELLFSRSSDPLESYAARFEGTRLEPSPENVRFEGQLFGYPACCVESYVAHGYRRNSLRRADQRLLFHWACPACGVTPRLLPGYRAAHAACREAWRAAGGRGLSRLARRLSSLSGGKALVRLAAAATLAVAAAGVQGMASIDPDPHVLPLSVWDDPDGDGLTSREEGVLGTCDTCADEDANGVPDGVDLAKVLAAALATLPTEASGTQPYVLHHMAFGLENCKVCGAAINMGVIEVVNPLENQSIRFPYMGQHYLEHGSFEYAGSVHSGRVNPALLKLLLTAGGLGHFLPEPVACDTDGDGLWDIEEPSFRCHPARPDTDGDRVPDGIDAARALRLRLDALPRAASEEQGPKDRPFVVEHPMDGIELCPRCGEWVVMDMWLVVNPLNGVSVSVPSMALHDLEHGGFLWKGGQLAGGEGRIDPRQLRAALGAESEEHWLVVSPDSDGDGLSDPEEEGLGMDAQRPDEDGNQVRDGADLALKLAQEIAALPDRPLPDGVYKEEHLLRGLETCDVCGAHVNMGWLVVCNPRAGLHAKLPYIGLHYFEHGGFSYAGDVHGFDRAEVTLLMDALHSKGPSHRLAVPGDADGDVLTDPEEKHFKTDPGSADTDGDGVPDGFCLAREQWRAVQALPRTVGRTTHAVDYVMKGLVKCDVCGQSINMGYVEVVNPARHLTLEIPYLTLHFMEHGSFLPSPGKRLDPIALDAILRPVVVVASESGRVSLCWLGQAGCTYRIESAAELGGPWEQGQVFYGEGGELRFEEAVEATAGRRFYRVVEE